MSIFKKFIPYNSLVRDKITGFEGFVTFRVEHLNGYIRYSVQPVVGKDGKFPESRVLDEPNLAVIAPPDENLPQPVEIPNAFKLGVKLKDRLSGLEGIAIARIKNRYSGDRYAIQPPVNEETREIPESVTFDEEDLEQIDPPPVLKKKKKEEEKPLNGPHDSRNLAGR